ncbi:MAG: hypothetical protein ACKOHM_01310, partial [Spartobacteria bacterium]
SQTAATKSNLADPFHARKPSPLTNGQMAISPLIDLPSDWLCKTTPHSKRLHFTGAVSFQKIKVKGVRH